MRKKFLMFVLGLFVGAFTCYSVMHQTNDVKKAVPKSNPAYATELYEIHHGSKQAPVKVIEYSSNGCWACSDFKKEDWPYLYKKFITTNKVHWVVRPYPLGQLDLFASMLGACCKDKGALSLAYYLEHEKWTGAKDPLEAIKNIAKRHGMNEKNIHDCLNDEGLLNKIILNRLHGSKNFFIEATPTFIIGDAIVSEVLLRKDFEDLLEKAHQHVQSGKALSAFKHRLGKSLKALKADYKTKKQINQNGKNTLSKGTHSESPSKTK